MLTIRYIYLEKKNQIEKNICHLNKYNNEKSKKFKNIFTRLIERIKS